MAGSGSTVPAAVVPKSYHDGSDITLLQLNFKGSNIHSTQSINCDLPKRNAQHRRDARMSVMRLSRSNYRLTRMRFPADPQCLHRIGEGSPTGQMAQMCLPSKHSGNLGNRLLLHDGTGPAAIEGMVVRIQVHGQRVSQPRQGMGRLEHLAQIKWMMVGVVFVETEGGFVEDGLDFPVIAHTL